MCRHNPLSLSILVIALSFGLTAAPAHAAPPVRPSRQTPFVPFSGTATLSYISSEQTIPTKAARDLALSQQVNTFAVRDATHWRVDAHITAPVLDSHDETFVANGSQIVEYNSLSNQAFRMPGGLAQSPFLLSALLRSPAPLGMTAAQYAAQVKRYSREKVRSLGQTQMLGRTVDVLRIAPLGWTSTGTCAGPKNCASKERGYGWSTVWLDQQHGLVLQYEQSGLPARFGGQRGYRYVVTSLTFGQGPSDTDLAYVPPVPVRTVPVPQSSGSQSSGGGSSGPGMSFQAPPGFIAVGNPDFNGTTMQVRNYGSGSGGPLNGSSYVEGLFRGAPSQGFVYVKEETRPTGLPATLTSGTAQTAGSCPVWTGSFHDGLTWLAMMRGQIAILVVANKLTAADLVQYAASGICTASIVPPPSAREVQDTALDHLETEIDITRQILGWAIASAPTAADKTTLRSFDARLASFDKTVFAIRHRSDPQAVYSPPGFPPPGKHQFADTVQGLKGEMGAAKSQLAAAEAAVQSPADRQTLKKEGAVFDDLIGAVDAMISA